MKKLLMTICLFMFFQGLTATADTRTDPQYCDTCHRYSMEYVDRAMYHNDEYHTIIYRCYTCYNEKTILEKHNFVFSYYEEDPEPSYNGTAIYTCSYCNCDIEQPAKWNPSIYCGMDEFEEISYVYPDSTSITLTFEKPFKGSVIQVKIGGKTYKKKVTNNKRKVKIKIKKPKKPYQKINIKVTYQGKKMFTDFYYVFYAKKISKGLTEKQVRFTKGWGDPDRKQVLSGGWKYYYYKDGSYVGFKNGKVETWYQ